jgi:drug/metabolite transporter (DMT)-like permease
MSPHARNLLQIHAAVLLFGFAGLFGDRRLLNLSSIVIVFARVAFASAVLLLAALVRRDVLRPVSRRSQAALVLLGILLAVHWTTFFQAVKTSSVAVALLTYATFPVFVAFLEPLFFRENLQTVDVVRAVLALAGVAILRSPSEWTDPAAEGVLWGIASAFTFALLSLCNRRFVRQHSSIALALYQDLFAAVVLLPFALADRQAVTVGDVLLLVVLGVLCTAVAHSLFIAGMTSVSARTASTLACLEPVYGIFLVMLFFRDVPELRTVLGGCVIVGVALHATWKG